MAPPRALVHTPPDANALSVEGVPVSVDDARRAMVGAGMPAWQADGLAELFGVYRAGHATVVTGGVAEATGREPRSFEGFARDHRAAFAGAGRAAS